VAAASATALLAATKRVFVDEYLGWLMVGSISRHKRDGCGLWHITGMASRRLSGW
jgi:hypothetical protein